MSPRESTEKKFDLSTKLLGGTFVGLGIGLIGLFTGLSSGNKEPFLGWLWGCAFWLSIAIGMLMLIMIFRVFNSQWTPVVRRQLEHGLAAFPWLALCFAPLLLIALFGGENSGVLWSWINPDSVTYAPPHLQGEESLTVADDVLHQKKSGYLNLYFFSFRLILYFGIFCGLSHWLRKVSFTQDKDGDPNWTHLGMKISAAGIPAAAAVGADRDAMAERYAASARAHASTGSPSEVALAATPAGPALASDGAVVVFADVVAVGVGGVFPGRASAASRAANCCVR